MRFVCVQMIDTTGPSRQKWAVSTATILEIKSKTTLSGVQLDAATINQTNLIPSIVAQVICVFLCNDWVLKGDQEVLLAPANKLERNDCGSVSIDLHKLVSLLGVK